MEAEIIISFSALVGITIGLVEVIKRAIAVETRFIPLVALIVGILLTLLASVTNLTSLTIISGIVVGLSAAGLYDQGDIVRG